MLRRGLRLRWTGPGARFTLPVEVLLAPRRMWESRQECERELQRSAGFTTRIMPRAVLLDEEDQVVGILRPEAVDETAQVPEVEGLRAQLAEWRAAHDVERQQRLALQARRSEARKLLLRAERTLRDSSDPRGAAQRLVEELLRLTPEAG